MVDEMLVFCYNLRNFITQKGVSQMHKKIVALLISIVFIMGSFAAFAQDESPDLENLNENLILHYDFNENANDKSPNGYNATLPSGAVITTFDQRGVVRLTGAATSYVQLPVNYANSLEDFTISTDLYIDPTMSFSTQWLWSFSNTLSPAATSGKYMGVLLNSWRGPDKTIYAITESGYNNESFVLYGIKNGQGTSKRLPKGEWKNITVTYSKSENKARIYVDGIFTGEETITLSPKDLGIQHAFIGKSPFGPDAYFQGYIDDFKIYGICLSEEEVAYLAMDYIERNIENDLNSLSLGDLSQVTKNLTLPTTTANDGTITWESSNPGVISNTGVVTRTEKDETVTLTATISYGPISRQKTFEVTVFAKLTDEQKIMADKEWFINKYANNVKFSLRDEYTGPEGTLITLTFPQDSLAISPDGTVTRGDSDEKVTVLATFKVGETEVSEDIEFTVKAKDVYTGYLFVNFGSDNTYENVYYLLSRDGKVWKNVTSLTEPIAVSTKGHGNVRDPQIVRGPEGLTLIHTNGTAPGGWGYGAVSSDFFSIWESNDNLATWENERIIKTIEGSYTNWAPEIFWDDANRQYVVHLAIRPKSTDRHITYYMTSKDLQHFSEPKIMFDPGYSAIDSTIQYENGTYYIFYKNEENASNHVTGKKIVLATTTDLYDPTKYVFYDREPIFPSNEAVEGPTVFKSNDGTKWYALADVYGGGRYMMWESETLAGPWRVLTQGVSIPSNVRHGTIIGITEEEFQAICDQYDFEFEVEQEVLQPTKPDTILPEQEGPILWYKFDGERTSKTVIDYSGNGNHGKYYGNATHSDDAKYGQSLYLDGNASYVKMPKHILKNVSSITVTSWVKLDPSLPAKQRIFDFGTDTNAYMFLSLNAADNTVQFTITNAGTAGSQRHPTSVRRVLPSEYVGTWIHTAAVLAEQPNGTYTMSLYINGEKFYDDLSGVSIGPWAIGGLNNYIGRSQFLSNGDRDFKGNIDDFRIYNRALSQDEIRALYNFAPSEITFDKDILVAGETVKASANIINEDKYNDTFALYLALYDAENKLVKVVSQKAWISLGQSGEIEAEIEIPQDLPEGCALKAYLWKGDIIPHASINTLE